MLIHNTNSEVKWCCAVKCAIPTWVRWQRKTGYGRSKEATDTGAGPEALRSSQRSKDLGKRFPSPATDANTSEAEMSTGGRGTELYLEPCINESGKRWVWRLGERPAEPMGRNADVHWKEATAQVLAHKCHGMISVVKNGCCCVKNGRRKAPEMKQSHSHLHMGGHLLKAQGPRILNPGGMSQTRHSPS